MRIDKVNAILFCIITSTFWADALLGIISYYAINLPSPPVLLRTIILFFSVAAFLKTKRLKFEKFFLVLMLISGFVAISWGNVNHTYSELLYDVSLLTKVLYGPMLIFLLFSVVQHWHISEEQIAKYLLYGAIVFAGVIVVPAYFGIGVANYEDVGGSGTRGLLFTANESGLELGMLLAVAIRQAFQARHRFLGIVSALFIAIALANLQSRFSLLSLLVSPLVVLVLMGTADNKSGVKHKPFNKLLLIFICIVMLGVFYVVYDNFVSNDFQRRRLEESSQGELPRAMQIMVGFNYLHNREVSYDLLGEGGSAWGKSLWDDINIKASESGVAQAELDWLDLFGSYGTFFSIAMYGFYLMIVAKVWVLRKNTDSVIAGIALLGMMFYFLHAFVAGHAMSSAAPSGVFMYLVIWSMAAPLNKNNQVHVFNTGLFPRGLS